MNTLKYFGLFLTNLICNENSIKPNYNIINLINIQIELSQLKEPKLLKSKIAFFSFEIFNITLAITSFIFDNVVNQLASMYLLLGTIYCAFFDFSNYTYILLLLNSMTIEGLINFNLSEILVGFTCLLPNYIKGYMHKKRIAFKKLNK